MFVASVFAEEIIGLQKKHEGEPSNKEDEAARDEHARGNYGRGGA